MVHRQAASLGDAFERALDDILTRVSVSAASLSSSRSFAIAYSGGLDSSALLHLACLTAAKRGLALYVFHVHHGISPNADGWLAHCERECAKLNVRFAARRVVLNDIDRHGTEQAARIARYAALGELCRDHKIPLLLTAHHLDDQAETVLLQLLRGSGVAGMSGMELVSVAPDLVGDSRLMLGRPLLNVARTELECFVATHNVEYVDDESNADPRYARNALRLNVMLSLAEYFPGFQDRFARAAQHARSAQRLLNELAEQDFAACRDGDCLNLVVLKELSVDRGDNLLRYWFALRGIRMPKSSWLSELRTQLFEARGDAQLLVTHPDCEIRRHRDKVFLTPRMLHGAVHTPSARFRWDGEAKLDFAAYGGSLCFDPAENGIDATWLRQQDLQLRYRHGGEKLKLASNRPTKSLKHHYQALNIPAWERSRLPLVCTSSGQLLYAAGIGMDWRDVPAGTECVYLRWEPADFQ